MFYEAIVKQNTTTKKNEMRIKRDECLLLSAGEFHLRGFGHWPCRKIPYK